MTDCIFAKPRWQESNRRICDILRASLVYGTYEAMRTEFERLQAERETKKLEGCDDRV